MSKRNWTALADSLVPIGNVLNDHYGIEVPHGDGEWKTNCPLDHEHRDGGKTKAMKVFTTSNSAWCFNHNEKFTPLKLWMIKQTNEATVRSLHPVSLAKDLLHFYGMLGRFVDPDERWELMDAEEQTEEYGSTDNLKEALRLYASTLPNYADKQYDEDVLNLMRELFIEANRLASDSNYATLTSWLDNAKTKLSELWRENDY